MSAPRAQRSAVSALSTSLLLILAAAAAPATPAAAAAGQTASARRAAVPADSAFFNNPADPARQRAITDHVSGLIGAAEPGSAIRVAVYKAELDTFASALTAAHRNGVSVQVIVDHTSTKILQPGGDWTDNPAYLKLADPENGLGTDKTARSWVMPCDKNAACIGEGDRVLMHNKFFTFSGTSGAENVVVQGSHNMTPREEIYAWNNALTLTGNAALYNAYNDYFADLSARIKNSNYYRTVSAGNAKAYFFPRAQTPGTSPSDPATDTIYNYLGYVSCTGGTTIRVGIYHLTRSAIARRLWDLDNKGCDVQVVYAILGETAAEALAKPGGNHGNPKVRNSNTTYSGPGGQQIPMYIHSKYLLINGTYNGTPNSKLVFTGSHNYTTIALRGDDESITRIDSPAIYDKYAVNFKEVWDNSPVTLRRNKNGQLLTGPRPPAWATDGN